ncbi:MAG: hypothetical protein EBZ49_13345, partial [Proteobacteria bacterium]|nr:hypothetical protein [Pseudomonadota bacterium]
MQKVIFTALLLSHALSAASDHIRIFYSANRQGEIEPCGCKTNQIGGLNRMAEKIMAASKSGDYLIVDSGDTFFSTPKLNENRKAQELLRARLIAKSYRQMGVAFTTPGDRDLAGGAAYYSELLAESGASAVSANWVAKDSTLRLSPYQIWSRDGLKILVTGLSAAEGVSPAIAEMVEPRRAMEGVLSVAKKEAVDFVLVLSHLGKETDEKLAEQFPGLFVFGAHSMDSLSEPIAIGNSFVLQPGTEGQQLGELQLEKGKTGFLEHALHDLSKNFDQPNAVKSLMQEYYASLKQVGLQDSADLLPGKSSYVANPFVCKNCHQKQFDFWASTKHSSAFLVLYAKKQHYDPQCIGCHSLGFNVPEGFSQLSSAILLSPQKKKGFAEKLLEKTFSGDREGALDSSENPARYRRLHERYWKEVRKLLGNAPNAKNFLGVQCEHCHQSRANHVQNQSRGASGVSLESCQQC